MLKARDNLDKLPAGYNVPCHLFLVTPLALPPEETVQRAKWFLIAIQSGMIVKLSRLGSMQDMASNLNSQPHRSLLHIQQ